MYRREALVVFFCSPSSRFLRLKNIPTVVEGFHLIWFYKVFLQLLCERQDSLNYSVIFKDESKNQILSMSSHFLTTFSVRSHISAEDHNKQLEVYFRYFWEMAKCLQIINCFLIQVWTNQVRLLKSYSGSFTSFFNCVLFFCR